METCSEPAHNDSEKLALSRSPWGPPWSPQHLICPISWLCKKSARNSDSPPFCNNSRLFLHIAVFLHVWSLVNVNINFSHINTAWEICTLQSLSMKNQNIISQPHPRPNLPRTPPHARCSPVFPPSQSPLPSRLLSFREPSTSGGTKPRPQHGSSPRALPRPTPQALLPRGSLSCSGGGAMCGQSCLGLNPPPTAQASGAWQRLRTLPRVCRSFVKPRNGVSQRQRGLPLLSKGDTATDHSNGHCQTSDVAVVHQDDGQRASQTSEVAWSAQKSL